MRHTPTDSEVHARSRQAAGCSRSAAQPAPLRTGLPVTHGFLKHSFAPMYEPAPDMPERSDAEADFFKSLGYLKKHYGLKLPALRSLPYPYNVLMAERVLNNQLETKNRHRELFVLEHANGKVGLSMKETLQFNYGLYFIPVNPLFLLWQDGEKLELARLLTAVCAYCYIEAGVCYHRDENNYMAYNYEILEDWLQDDKESLEVEDYRAEEIALNNAKEQGDYIRQKMLDHKYHRRLASLTALFSPVTEIEKEALTLAERTMRLASEFPGRNIYQHASPCNRGEYDVDEPEVIGMHEYISFVGSTDDALSDNLLSIVNTDFNERPNFQEPEVVTHFDEQQPPFKDTLTYDFEIIDLIDDLIYLLNRIK